VRNIFMKEQGTRTRTYGEKYERLTLKTDTSKGRFREEN